MRTLRFQALFLLVASLFASCSLNQIAVNVLADTLAGEPGDGATVFTSDDDPELIGEALPFALKLYESILAQTPDHERLLLAAGSGFVSYANAFVATPAGMLPFDEWDRREAMQKRAKRLYLRGREYLLRGLEVRHPGFRQALFAEARAALIPYLDRMEPADVPYLYWTGAGWVAAFSLDVFDLELALTVPRVEPLMLRALDLDETFSDGAIHDFFVHYYAGLPEAMGGNPAKVDYHHARALEIAGGRLAGPFVSYAEAVAIPRQDVALFVDLLERALAVDPDDYPPARLVNILAQRKARWYLGSIDDFFLPDWPEDEGDEL